MPETVIIRTHEGEVVTCPPNLQHAGEVVFVPTHGEPHPRCPVCGRCAA